MQVYHLSYPLSLESYKIEPSVIAIGYFDGVHLGHQKVIHTAKKMAERLDVPLAVMTFHPHPKKVLEQKSSMRYLTPINEKINRFQSLGVKKTYVMKFDQNLAALSAEEFIENVCISLQVRGIVTGFNFRFGKKQSGDANDLRIFSRNRYETEKVEAVLKKGRHVSSTWIRQLLSNGEVELVNELLGRCYQFQGIVEHGDHRGRLIGFPTANLSVTLPYYLPKRGVYIVQAHFDETSAYGLMNIGVRPTFKQSTPQEKVEVHLFHPDVNLYGKKMLINVLKFLRPEQKFASVDALIHQIQNDKKQAEKWLSTERLFT